MFQVIHTSYADIELQLHINDIYMYNNYYEIRSASKKNNLYNRTYYNEEMY